MLLKGTLCLKSYTENNHLVGDYLSMVPKNDGPSSSVWIDLDTSFKDFNTIMYTSPNAGYVKKGGTLHMATRKKICKVQIV